MLRGTNIAAGAGFLNHPRTFWKHPPMQPPHRYTMHCAIATNATLTMLLVVVAVAVEVTSVAVAEAAQLPGYPYPLRDCL